MAILTWAAPPPSDPETLKNPQPFAPFFLVQVRAGKIKKSLGGGRIESAILKAPISGAIEVTKDGIITDEHAFEPHRHPDNALLHYHKLHYDDWAREIPTSRHIFRPGAFGENMCNEEVSERTVCIGDRIAIGDIVVEVSQPRSPCYKLNHRFEVKDMAKRTQTLLRTGWLYRVVKPGIIRVPVDMVRLLDRPYPDWTVARVMHYLFIETNNTERMKEIVQLPALGEDVKGKFQARLSKGFTEDQSGRMFGGEFEKMDMWNEYRLVEKRKETSKVTAFTFEAVEDNQEGTFIEPGSHVRIKLGGKLTRAYSVVGGTSTRFELGVALDANSRGGSRYLHEATNVGDILTIGRITANFPLSKDADRHVIIAGGIGITAFLAAIPYLKQTNQNFHVHYAVAKEVPFASAIATFGSNVTLYNKSLGQRVDLSSILSHANSRTHIYACGPERLMHAVQANAKRYSIPKSLVHFEQFTVSTSGAPFTAELRQSGAVVEVGSAQSLLDVLKTAGIDVDSSCEVGNCGTCKVDVADGMIEHRGTALMDEEKCGAMLSCVSRGVGRIVLNL